VQLLEAVGSCPHEMAACRIRQADASRQNGHVISWQRRDVNLSPDPILKLMAVASCRGLYIIRSSTQRWSVAQRFAWWCSECGRLRSPCLDVSVAPSSSSRTVFLDGKKTKGRRESSRRPFSNIISKAPVHPWSPAI